LFSQEYPPEFFLMNIMSPQELLVDTSRFVKRLSRYHRFIVFGIEIVTIAAAGFFSFLLRFDLSLPPRYVTVLLIGLAVWLPLKLGAFMLLGVSRGWWRYFSLHDLVRLVLANVLGSGMSTVLLLMTTTGFPRSVYFGDLVLCLLFTAGTRFSARLASEFVKVQSSPNGLKRTLIYGAGDAGIALLREIRQNATLNYDVCGFIDDDRRKKRMKLQGTQVMCSGPQLPTVAKEHAIELVLIAIPSASGAEVTRIIERCHEAGLTFKTIPGLGEIVEDESLTRQIRDVAVEDLLGRAPVHLEEEHIAAKLQDRTVLVTGAAGSIGSELCRQIARFRPAAIVGYDTSETPLFHLEQEFARVFPGVRFCAEIGSVQNRQRLNDIFEQYRPSVVYHAAAYKHVPMMEAHVFEAIENNVIGTYNVAMAAREHRAGDFVLISSDKAVRPTNVMGATKRVSELAVLSLQNSGTRFVTVRFGNVLGSNGSVIPIFKQQIAAGGPVTVTHPEMRRYFMTIPEAAQLVIQASSMDYQGKVLVLEMGAPVKIVDLARNLILLSGLRPDEDIKIEFTGIRPGEKLYEELSSVLENTACTSHEKIRIFTGTGAPVNVDNALRALDALCTSRDLRGVILALKELVPDYNPSANLLRRMVAALDETRPDRRALKARVASTQMML
jgi:FlaA1/EpsC-like NDP-sugar epimerase